ncbi:MAG: glutamate 5-kinase [Planctomycetales bacterium]|nr:glutamate 5-kinase [Planctomycetales bacterium]MBN8624332.1 glutamate 5-kinase [Planctomycetota bacterium]
MTDPLRQEIALAATTIVVKVGTRTLTRPDGSLDESRIEQLATQLHLLMETGRKVVLVSSGAVASGMGRLGLKERPRDLAKLQAVAAVGQSYLVQTYDRVFRSLGRQAAQVLLTADDLDERARYLNVRNTLLTLLEFGAVPIINENDTVSTEELQTTFGDNDRLAAMVTNLIRAPLLVLLSDVLGLYDGDPSVEGSKLISTVVKIDESIYGLVRDKKTGLSKGGMASKLNAARAATLSGENVIITSGKDFSVLSRIAAGESVGTLFLAQGQAITSWKRWIGFTAQPRGVLVLDEGAREAVEKKGRSLLAAGVVDVQGDFTKGDVVAVRDRAGFEFARGLTNYSAAEVLRIKGMKTEAIAAALGHCPYQEVIHRDNMAVTV